MRLVGPLLKVHCRITVRGDEERIRIPVVWVSVPCTLNPVSFSSRMGLMKVTDPVALQTAWTVNFSLSWVSAEQPCRWGHRSSG